MVNQVNNLLEDYPNRINNDNLNQFNQYNQVSLISYDRSGQLENNLATYYSNFNNANNNYDWNYNEINNQLGNQISNQLNNQNSHQTNSNNHANDQLNQLNQQNQQNQFNHQQQNQSNREQIQYSRTNHQTSANHLIRRNSFQNQANYSLANFSAYDQSTDSQQYLLNGNNYYQLSSGSQTENNFNLSQDLQHQPIQQQHSYQQQQTDLDAQFIENYHHLNHNSNHQFSNNPNYIYDYCNDYLNQGENLNFTIRLFDGGFFKCLNEAFSCIKYLCSKNFACVLLVLIPILIATVLILIFIKKINYSEKTDKHKYALIAFVIFSLLFIFPFALFFFVVLVNKIIKKYNKCFHPRNSLGSNEYDIVGCDYANSLGHVFNPNLLTATNLTNSLNNNVNQTANLNTSHNSIDHTSNHLINNQIDFNLQNNLLANQFLHQQQHQNHQVNTLLFRDLQNQQISTLNVNEIIEESQFDQEVQNTLQRMSSIQRRQRLIRQNAQEIIDSFDCLPEQSNQQQNEQTNAPANDDNNSTNNNLIYEDKPPTYELALLCPRNDDDEKGKKESDKKISKVNLNTGTNIINDTTANTISSTNLSITITSSNSISESNNSNNNLQTELQRNLENRRRSSNGSSITTTSEQPPAYSSLYRFEEKENGGS